RGNRSATRESRRQLASRRELYSVSRERSATHHVAATRRARASAPNRRAKKARRSSRSRTGRQACGWVTMLNDKIDKVAAANPFVSGGHADLLSCIPFLVLMLLLYLVGREILMRPKYS